MIYSIHRDFNIRNFNHNYGRSFRSRYLKWEPKNSSKHQKKDAKVAPAPAAPSKPTKRVSFADPVASVLGESPEVSCENIQSPILMQCSPIKSPTRCLSSVDPVLDEIKICSVLGDAVGKRLPCIVEAEGNRKGMQLNMDVEVDMMMIEENVRATVSSSKHHEIQLSTPIQSSISLNHSNPSGMDYSNQVEGPMLDHVALGDDIVVDTTPEPQSGSQSMCTLLRVLNLNFAHGDATQPNPRESHNAHEEATQSNLEASLNAHDEATQSNLEESPNALSPASSLRPGIESQHREEVLIPPISIGIDIQESANASADPVDVFLQSISNPPDQPLLPNPALPTDLNIEDDLDVNDTQRRSTRLANKMQARVGKDTMQLAQELLCKKLGELPVSPSCNEPNEPTVATFSQHLDNPINKITMDALQGLVEHGSMMIKKNGGSKNKGAAAQTMAA
jgi:hypothetical protein